ncbi:MMPL family transporter [Nocardia sp. NPDC052566]|uniref:MMPL family transporter n=1 Tax=Nocardia sp. NPDC052566 TaxID=3364330 RepID=UPI0037C82DBA
MFTRWGDLVFKLRFAVIGAVVAALLALGGYGLGLEDHLSSSGWDDPTSESAQAARISDEAYGRDHNSDVIVLYSAPDGKTIDDPEWSRKIIDSLNALPKKYPNEISKVNGTYWKVDNSAQVPSTFGSKDRKYAFASVAIVGDNDTDMVRNYRKVKDAFAIPGVDVQVAGLQAVAGTLNDTMAQDQKRMEMLAIPAVAILLFFIFGGVVAAALPLIVGGLTVIGAWGIVRFVTEFTEVNSFVSPVVSMIGLGLAIDYGLFIVSRFREELAEGYDTKAAVRRSVMTAGRTVIFSATMIIASLGGMLLFPQGFLKSIAYGSIATVTLAAITAITILPAMLAILGPRVDMLGFKKFRKTKTAEDIENGFWGKSTRWVMKHPLKIAIPICILLLLLIIPVKNLAFGGINERYLPPDDSTRLAQAKFDSIFPLRKSDPIQLVFVSDNSNNVGKVWKEADKAPGLAGTFEVPSQSTIDRSVFRTSATLADSEDPDATINYLRSMDVPDDVKVYVGGQPTIQKDSIDALLSRMPWMIGLVLLVTMVLMFLTFGSLVLPIKAALMSALGLGSTLGVLTWIFIDGHGSGLLNFTPQPIMSPVLVLIIAVIYGLSVDYEVFLLSRMVEARTKGASTTEAVRIGTAQTGRIITAAALILLVVTGAFAFSKLVMMKYLAYGMVAALFIDATILRMLLVPATMKLLGDDCWWAPAWMKKVQQKIGLGEPVLDDELPGGGELVDLVKTTPITDPVTTVMPAIGTTRKTPRRPRTIQEIESAAPTVHLDSKNLLPKPDPTRPMPPQVSESPRATPTEPTRPAPTDPGAPQANARAVPPIAESPRPTEYPARVAPPAPSADSAPDYTARVLPPTRSGDTASDYTARAVPPNSVTPSPTVAPSPMPPTPLSTPGPTADPTTRVTPPPTAPPSRIMPPTATPPSDPTPRVVPPTQATGFTARPQPPSPMFGDSGIRPAEPTARVTPPPPFTPTPTPVAPAPQSAEPPAEPDRPTHHAASETPEPDNGPDTNRSSIENWMAELRSSRRRIGNRDEGRHHSGDGRTVSVNELLRRRDEE